MFSGVALLCFLISFVSTEPWLGNIRPSNADEMLVTITLDGDHAHNYVRMVKSQTVLESFREKGVVQIEGVLISSGGGGLLVRHVAIIKIIGEPLQVLTLESLLDSDHATDNRKRVNDPHTTTGRNSIRLSDKHQVRMSIGKLVGGFPDSVRYH